MFFIRFKKYLLWSYLGLAGGSVVFLLLSLPFLCGFRRGGVSKGSNAAYYQSVYGDVAEGSKFSCCQFIGTTPVGTQIAVVCAIVCATGSAIAASLCYLDCLFIFFFKYMIGAKIVAEFLGYMVLQTITGEI